MSGATTLIQNDYKHRVHDQPSWHGIQRRIHYVVLTDTAYLLVLSFFCLSTSDIPPTLLCQFQATVHRNENGTTVMPTTISCKQVSHFAPE